ncbi:acyltransferase family protein [Noviherbaspirillum cavernae]|nr:acyltransferase [Noviherbaspirillum cavernae]
MKKILGFDALRALSVVLVILSHVGIIGSVSSPILKAFFTVFNANTGVTIFFVLSGFLITSLLISEYKSTGSISIKNFFIRRALRILPLYYLVVAMTMLIYLVGEFRNFPYVRFQTILHALTYTYNFIPSALEKNFLSHLWSLAVEEQFYLLWPFVFFLLIGKTYRLVLFCIAFVACCFAFYFVSVNWGELQGTFSLDRWFIPAAYPIIVGCLFALLINGVNARERYAKVLSSPLALACSFILVCSPLFLPQTVSFVVHKLAIVLGIAGIISWIFLNQSSLLVKHMDWGPIGYIGTISYGLYVWQGVLTGNGSYREIWFFPPPPLLGALLTFLVAPLSYHYFERWFLVRKSRYSKDSVPVTVHSAANEHLQLR